LAKPQVALTDVTLNKGSGFTVTVAEAVEVQPLVLVTEYVLVVDGETVIEVVVAPVLQVYPPPPLAVNVTLCPLQMVLPPVMETVLAGAQDIGPFMVPFWQQVEYLLV